MSDRAEDVREIVQRGLWFEDFQDGVIYRHRPGRTVTEADNVLFTTLTMNTQSLHLDAAWSQQQPFGQRLVNSMFTLATVVGLSVAQLTEGTIVANLGFSKVTFPKPMFHGDTLYAETALLSKRVSASRNGEGIVTLQHTGRNQHGEVVVRAHGQRWSGSAHDDPERNTPRAGLVVLPSGPSGTIREGRRRRGRRHPRFGGWRCPTGQGIRAEGSAGHTAGSRAHRGAGSIQPWTRNSSATWRRFPEPSTRP